MTTNKLIIGVSFIVTLFVLSLWLGDNESAPGLPAENLPSRNVDLLDSDCPSMSDFMMHSPDPTPEKMYEIEQCNREQAKLSGADQANTGFLGNTHTRPAGALAHYEMSYGRAAFTVYDDRIEASDSGADERTIIPFSQVNEIGEDREMPSAVVIDYTSEQGTQYSYTFMLLRDDDQIKAEGARDIDRLISLLESQRIEYQ